MPENGNASNFTRINTDFRLGILKFEHFTSFGKFEN